MAALVRHGGFKTGALLSPKNVLTRFYATKAEKKKGIDRKVGPKIDSSMQSLAAKGFLRSQKEYTPPKDVGSQVQSIFQKIVGSNDETTRLTDLNQRFTVFTACSDQFCHSIPNSLLHTIETLADLKTFYETPVDVTTPLDKFKDMDLPENLHIQYEYHRFHPDTDTKFGGVTAFPESSTIVTSLKYKEKYKGHSQKTFTPYVH